MKIEIEIEIVQTINLMKWDVRWHIVVCKRIRQITNSVLWSHSKAKKNRKRNEHSSCLVSNSFIISNIICYTTRTFMYTNRSQIKDDSGWIDPSFTLILLVMVRLSAKSKTVWTFCYFFSSIHARHTERASERDGEREIGFSRE